MIVLYPYSRKSKDKQIVRIYSSQGLYPTDSIYESGASLVVNDELIYSVTKNEPWALENYYLDNEWLSLAEVRFHSSIVLSIEPAQGKILLYPHPFAYEIDDTYDVNNVSTRKELEESLIQKLSSESDWYWKSFFLPPCFGGRKYEKHSLEMSDDLRKLTFEAISIKDYLLLRGLEALLKGEILMINHLFHNEACMSAYIAMDASFQIILLRLKDKIENPTSQDASKYLAEVLGEEFHSEKYFGGYYEDRIRTIHPSNRFGVFPHAPLEADDYFDLHDNLKYVYSFLITNLTAW
jgi:hypothetical protein